MIDQGNAEYVIDAAFRPDPNSASFQRPRCEMNVASGCPLFCSLAELNKRAYVRDDVIIMTLSLARLMCREYINNKLLWARMFG